MGLAATNYIQIEDVKTTFENIEQRGYQGGGRKENGSFKQVKEWDRRKEATPVSSSNNVERAEKKVEIQEMSWV